MTPVQRGCMALLVAVMLFAPLRIFSQWFYELHEQSPTISGGLFSNADGLVAADQFVLTEPAAITGIQWYGFFQNSSIVVSGAEPPEFRFRIRFFEDGSGIPAQQISQQDVSARARTTGVRTRLDNNPENIYEFTAALPQPVAMNAGTTAWISISAIDAPASWLWSRSIADLTDTLAVKDETLDQGEPLDWRSSGGFGQLAFTLIAGSIDDLRVFRPASPPRPRLAAGADGPVNPLTSGSTESRVAIVEFSEPQHTDLARRARVSGTVVLDVLVQKDGSHSIMGIVEGLGFGLDEMARSALQRWRFSPQMRDGQPVDSRLYVEIQFRLPAPRSTAP